MSESSTAQQGGEVRRELTLDAIVLGLGLSVVMGAANVYFGLKAGMTVSASIPAAVVAMGLLRGVLKRGTIYESNLVQTAASAGESLAAGIIFTMPALVIAGIWSDFDYWITTGVAMAGGLLGVLFMIPMRRVFVVDNDELPYPEGVACAEVLMSAEGDEGAASEGAGIVFKGIGLGGLFKALGGFIGLIKGSIEGAVAKGGAIFFLGCDVSPGLVGVGYIVGLNIAVLMFLGGFIGWLVGIPLLGRAAEFPHPVDGAWELWSTQIRYLGVGTMAVGGIWSIWHVRGGLVQAVKELTGRGDAGKGQDAADITERNLAGQTIIGVSAVAVAVTAWIYHHLTGSIGLTVFTTVIMIVMSFFFTAVASYIVGLVGNSNSPVSGMTITAVLFTGAMMIAFGFTGEAGMLATLGVAGVVCCAACTSGDVCNDLKTGALIGASPRQQQIMQVAAVMTASFVMAPVLVLLHKHTPGGIGGRELSAPQATLFAKLAQGFFGKGELPRDMVYMGAALGGVVLVIDAFLARAKSTFRLYIMPVAVGIYLPLGLSVPMIIGALIQKAVRRASSDEAASDENVTRGVLVASGVIAGEALMGIGLVCLIALGVDQMGIRTGLDAFRASEVAIVTPVLFAGVIWLFYHWSFKR